MQRLTVISIGHIDIKIEIFLSSEEKLICVPGRHPVVLAAYFGDHSEQLLVFEVFTARDGSFTPVNGGVHF